MSSNFCINGQAVSFKGVSSVDFAEKHNIPHFEVIKLISLCHFKKFIPVYDGLHTISYYLSAEDNWKEIYKKIHELENIEA